ncbi:Protein IMPACT [Leucoagaricus sp. SymC.cos]|nr:Protein IMPACT [Leucoagaricus sp. SymC.cos]
MARTPSPPSDTDRDYVQELQDFIAGLYQRPECEAIASELEVLQSIYGEEAIRMWHLTSNGSGSDSREPGALRYTLKLNLPSYDSVKVKFLVSLPPTYPVSSPPQLQLLSRYIGSFGADANLFGSILRTFISVSGVEFTPENVCVFDGVQDALERCNAWYEDRLSEDRMKEMIREDEKEANNTRTDSDPRINPRNSPERTDDHRLTEEMPPGIHFFIAEPIVDRKSSFIGRACRISDPSEVPLILAHLMSERRIARAAHPIINAWRCQVGTILHQDNDDDGETAAGGRLAHLLQILEVNNVLVVVTRYFGGIHLGPDRFKHINQAARNALDLGGFLDPEGDKRAQASRGKRH